jgi:plastocyanin
MLRRALVALALVSLASSAAGRSCPDPGALAALRSRIATGCDCAGATTHGAYVKCARAQAKAAKAPAGCRAAAIRCAAKSTCGKPGRVACCVPRKGRTTCRVVRDAAACGAKHGTAGACASCCDACADAACVAGATTTTTPGGATTTTAAASTGTTPPSGGTTTTTSGGATTTTPAATTTTVAGATTTTVGGTTHTVQVGQGRFRFVPDTLTIAAGDTVRWVWATSGHTVTSGTVSGGVQSPDGLFCSPSDQGCDAQPASNAGAIYDHTFPTPGTYHYYCSPHAALGMVGTITVQ